MLENLVAWYPQNGISNSSHSKAFLHLIGTSWTLNLEVRVHSIWVCGQHSLQECKGNFFFLKSGWVGGILQLGSQKNSQVTQGLHIADSEPQP